MPSTERQVPDVFHYDARHLLDLRLIHHYSVFTTQSLFQRFPEMVLTAFQEYIPRLAFRHGFLMDAILLVSIVHLSCTDSESLDSLRIYVYRDQALRTLREAVMNVSPQNINAVLGASVLHTTISLATDRVTRQPGLWIANWLALVLGQRHFRSPEYDSPARLSDLLPGGLNEMQSQGSLYGSFADLPDSAQEAIAVDIERALAREEEKHGGQWAGGSVLRKAASKLGRLISLLEHPYEDAWLERKIKAWAFEVVPYEFGDLVRQAQPTALVVIGYYLALFQLLPDSWSYQGVASHDLEEIRNNLDPTWSEYLAVPDMALRTNDRTTLAQVLLRSLPTHEKQTRHDR